MVSPQSKPRQKLRVKNGLEPAIDAMEQQQQQTASKFARALGSVDYTTREQGVKALTRFLQRKTDISEGDMLKLWRGMYFCFWHSDKQPVQVGGVWDVIRMLTTSMPLTRLRQTLTVLHTRTSTH